jgi:hypothetical protein
MKRLLSYCALCLLSIGNAAESDLSRRLFGDAATNNLWSREIDAPVLFQTNAIAPKPGATALSQLLLRPIVQVAGVRLGMSKDQVLAAWGKPESAENFYMMWSGRDSASLSYPNVTTNQPKVQVCVIFGASSGTVAAVWLLFPVSDEKDYPWPTASECLATFGEPAIRNYIPEPLNPPKPAPRHWYCRMVYRTTNPAMVLYFCNGKLMGLEVNPEAKGALPKGAGSDDNSIPFSCLAP